MIHRNKFAMACALSTGLLWVVCSMLVVCFPETMLRISVHMFHIDSEQLSWTLTWSGFFLGFISWVIFAGATGLILSEIYNRLVRN